MRALVTGAAGFIGSKIVNALLADGADVVGIDSFTDYYSQPLKQANLDALQGRERFRLVRQDLNKVDLEQLLAGVQVVYHQAGQPGVRKSWGAEFQSYTRDNIEATQRLLEACTNSSTLQKMVYASSSSVYGNAARYPTVETDRPQPLSPYGVTKLAAEHLCSLYARNYGVPTVSLRYFTVYGPGQRPDMAFTRFLRAAARDEPISVYGTGSQIRDFTYVDDIVQANLLAGKGETPLGAVYNVAGGSHVSLGEAIDVIRAVTGRPLRVNVSDSVPGDVQQTGGSTRALHEALGWTPRVDLEEGLARQWSWIVSNPQV